MNGIHDMGGMHGFGSVEIEINEPVFHYPWEGRARSMVALARDIGYFNIDEFRYGIEQMAPSDYLDSSYFERWLASLEFNLIREGQLTQAEIDATIEKYEQHPETAIPDWPEKASEPLLAPVWMVPAPAASKARFVVGDPVVVTNTNPETHTRKPRYVRGKQGVIGMVHGIATLPDANAHGLGENPEPLYSVQFDGHELWGDSAEPNQTLSIDLWESYLIPA